jgi:sugar phosphate isomerase/epimerase
MTHQTTRRSFLKRAAITGTAFAMGTQYSRAESVLPYTAKDISARLGISMAVYQKERLGARHIAAVRAAGIKHIELTMIPERIDIHDRTQISEILTECKRQEVSIVSIHANLQRRYNHPDEEERRAAAAHLLEEIRFAERIGAGIVVAHLGTNDQSRKTVTEMLEKTKDMRIHLTVENMRGGLKPYAAFVDKIGADRFGMTVDIGHIRDTDGINPMVKKGCASDVLTQGGKRIWHLHLHDTFNLKTKPDHRAPMHPDGIIEWGEVFTALRAIDYRGIFLFEDGRGENPEQWVRLAGEFPRNFVARYSG